MCYYFLNVYFYVETVGTRSTWTRFLGPSGRVPSFRPASENLFKSVTQSYQLQSIRLKKVTKTNRCKEPFLST